MNQMEDLFTFEDSPWDLAAEKLSPGDTISAVRVLTLLEDEDEEAVEGAFQTLTDLRITPDLGDLPRAACSGQAADRLRMEMELAKEADMTQGLAKDDPLRIYLEDLASVPVCGDEQVLADQSIRGDDSARAKLADLSLSRVVELARDYAGYGVLLLDLIQEGSLGLWQGILSYESGDFAAVRDWWIRHFMVCAILHQARQNGVLQHTRQALEDYRSVDERLLTDLGRNPTVEEISEALHITPEDGDRLAKMLENARILEQARAAVKKPEESPEDDQAVEDTAYFQMRERINDLLSGLEETDVKILTMRFGLEGGLPLSAEDTGKKLGMTSSQVVAREAAALSKLRKE